MVKRRALITGSSRGIGSAIAHKLKELGYLLLTPARNELDLSSNESIDHYISILKDPVDILINNAGINPLASITDISDINIESTLQINLIAPMRLIKNLAPGMIDRHYGRIINISSIWSSVSKEKRVIYSSSKAGLNAMTRSVAVELARYNILINSIAPGFVNTELTKQNNTEKEINIIKEKIPIGRLAEPEEIAETVAFLCSDKNTYITGQTIIIDGGYTCL
ncbi:MAG: SDR family oxidoreductase [Candidatus Eremiobacterota bacterium]